ncbi:hypothetical protein N7537_003235 [Penicillium hordei]|uniref:HNH nuclease domain-containing protein n=1 Tax=Penicillium hordei TaxID=40994 RepID=A0AAD6H9N2_9EURO|nr:uncharacterized protein N7537_003235 [Penicillium hordei]KAJ5618121.1 hypothetical protein N7537_003235 [Penicillium hordei]
MTSHPLIADLCNPVESLRTSESDTIKVLKKRKVNVERDILFARKEWKPSGLFDQNYWSQAAKIERLSVQREIIDRKISQGSFSGKEIDWEATEEAKRILERINAHKQTERICKTRAAELREEGTQRTLRASFMRLFTTSKMGINISWTGAGKRKRDTQSDWKQDMVEAYNAKHPDQTWLWCPITHQWRPSEMVVAAHLFGYMHGQGTMDAIFGKGGDIFSSRNGLLVSLEFERYFDSGKMAIVPDVGENAGVSEMLYWLSSKPREFKVKILDQDWKKLDDMVDDKSGLTYRKLEDRRLNFRSNFRPAARYLYFHYCVQVLRRAWQYTKDTDKTEAAKDHVANVLYDTNGKLFWGTPGRYLPRNMLLALVEELGHEYKPLLNGAASSTSADSDMLLELAANQTKARRKSLSDDLFSFEYSDTDDD